MDLNLECIYCTINKVDRLFSEHEADEDRKLQFMKKVFKIISESEAGDTPPYLAARLMGVLDSELQLGDIYYRVKKEFNEFLMLMEEEILNIIYAADDKLLAALKFAMVGNFVDFGAMDKVEIEGLKNIIKKAPQQLIDAAASEKFLKEMENTQQLVYICDNAGEIVMDKIFIKIIQGLYPGMRIDVIVRGKPVYNDATMADAEEVGLCKLVHVVDNGTDIPGTQLSEINEESKTLLDKADLIISKGQGNFETLFGCGKNIFYIFLCKCDLFTKRFNLERFKGVFVSEYNVKDLMSY